MLDAAAGAPAIDRSKMNAPPAPMVKLVPSSRAYAEVAIRVPGLSRPTIYGVLGT